MNPYRENASDNILTYYWSRKPGNFLDYATGAAAHGAQFTGNISEWYETLGEVMLMMINKIYMKTGFNVVHVKTGDSTVIECSVMFKPSLKIFQCIGCKMNNVGSYNDRFNVWLSRDVPVDEIHFMNYDNNVLLGKIQILDMSVF